MERLWSSASQPGATIRESARTGYARTSCKPLHLVATGCRSEHMVRISGRATNTTSTHLGGGQFSGRPAADPPAPRCVQHGGKEGVDGSSPSEGFRLVPA